ncbi:MAG: hypothetical protein ACOX3R_16735 [Desulfitobacteriia bacterium]|jgi:hypothetical protein
MPAPYRPTTARIVSAEYTVNATVKGSSNPIPAGQIVFEIEAKNLENGGVIIPLPSLTNWWGKAYGQKNYDTYPYGLLERFRKGVGWIVTQ